MDNLSVGLTFLAGLLSFASPCVLPLVPAYVSYMGGRMTHTVSLQLAGDGRAKIGVSQRANMLLHGVAFVLGFTLVFVTIGLMTTAFVSVLGSAATVFKDVLGRAGGVLIIFFGLHFMGAWRWLFAQLRARPAVLASPITTIAFGGLAGLLILWAFIEWVLILPLLATLGLWLVLGGGLTTPHAFWTSTLDLIDSTLYNDTRRETQFGGNRGLGGSFLMGVVFSAGWTPCIGPIYGSVLTLAVNTGDALAAMPLLVAYSFGLGVPFLLAALLLDSAQSVFKKLQRHMRKIELASGTLLVFMGFMVASGQLQRLTQVLGNDFAEFTYRLEECGVGLFNNDLSFSQLGSCVEGSTLIVAVNQGANGVLNSQIPQVAYVFHLAEPIAVDIEVWNISNTEATLSISLLDENGQALYADTTLHPIANDRFVALPNTSLEAKRYTVAVQSDAEVSFRLRLRAAQPLASTAPSTVTLGNESTRSSDDASVGSITAFGTSESVAVGLEIGNVAPSFTVTTLGGDTLQLSQLRGQVVILNFWGTWCAPCRREIPDLQALYADYGTEGLFILGLAVRDTAEAVQDFQQAFGVTFPLALDTNETITNRYAVVGQPTTIIIGKDGKILRQFFSVISHDTLVPIIESAINAS